MDDLAVKMGVVCCGSQPSIDQIEFLGNARDADLFSAREDARPPSQGFRIAHSPVRSLLTVAKNIRHALASCIRFS